MSGVIVVNPVIVADGYGNLININHSGRLLTDISTSSIVSAVNSTTDLLDAYEVFTGVGEDVKDYATISIFVFSDVASATGGLKIEWSTDNSNWDDNDTFDIPANNGKFFTFGPEARYFRVVYTNDTQNQTAFRLQVIYHYTSIKPSSHKINEQIDDNSDAELVKGVITGKDTDGIYRDISVTSTGRLIVSSTNASANINGFSDGRIVYSSTTITSVRETTYTEQSSDAQRSVASSSASDTSAGTGARTIRITYYTSAFVGPNTTDVTLNGTSAVNTSVSDICYIEKIEVLTVGSGGQNAGIITLYASTGGAGGTIWTIAVGSNKTYSAHHYVAAGRTCFITGMLVGIKGADTTSGFLRAIDLSTANSADIQISDTVRAPSSGQSFRTYGAPIVITEGFRITGMVAPDSSSSRTYYLSFDFYEE